jgi:crotonobetainyl-CoA:carnitine CoA-transferase CaiB-like acyl-CoA transferase
LELGANYTAPFATMILADQGADVIKIEPPEGDLMRHISSSRGGVSTLFINANRNKRSVCLDLKVPGNVATVCAIAKTCDIVIQNYRPGVAERLGLGYETLREGRDDLIYVSVSGFGATGPYATLRAYDCVIQAVSGAIGGERDTETKKPRVVRNIIADKVTALTVAQAMTAALLERSRTGRGQHVEVSMLSALLFFNWPDLMAEHTLTGPGVTRVSNEVRILYETADGYIVAVAMSDPQWRALTQALGRPALAQDPRFSTAMDRIANGRAVFEELQPAFLAQTTAIWLKVLADKDCVFAPVNLPEDVWSDPQVVASGLVEADTHPTWGDYRRAAPSVAFASEPEWRRRPAPLLGEHTEQVIAECGQRETLG